MFALVCPSIADSLFIPSRVQRSKKLFQSISISTTTVKQENQRDERAWGEITPAVKALFTQSRSRKE